MASAASFHPSSSFSSHLSIPPTLSKTLAHPKTPWLVSAYAFDRLRPAPGSDVYRKSEITKRELEWDFVHQYFNDQRPYNRSIKRIYCVHNPVASKQFEGQIESSEVEAHTPDYAPEWQKEEPLALRKKVYQRWLQITEPFSGFALDARHTNVRHTRILPLWHGTSEDVCRSICETGFTDVGKHHLISGGLQGAGKVSDIGYFGNGIYFTTSARYAADIYSDGHLLLAWVSMREPFPVVADRICTPPNEPKDMKLLKGQGHRNFYNAHYIPVVSVDPTDPDCPIYYPCAKEQTPAWDEVVVFNKFQTLPRFWIELDVDILRTPSPPIYQAGKVSSYVTKKFSELQVEPKKTPRVPLMAFGKAKWEEYIGEIGDEPPLPADIEAILNSSCPFWKDKRVRDTHLLMLIPETVNSEPLTLKSLGELVKSPKQGQATQYYTRSDFGLGDSFGSQHDDISDRPAGPSHWVLMTTDVLPGSRNKSYDDQQKLVQSYSAKSKIVYQVPNALDAATTIFMEYISSGTCLYNNSPRIFTRSLEKVMTYNSIACHPTIGNFSPGPGGLVIVTPLIFDGANESIGVAGLRKL